MEPVSRILVETCTDIDQELCLGAVVDVLAVVSFSWHLLKVVLKSKLLQKKRQKKSLKLKLTHVGAQPHQGRELAFKLGLEGKQINQFVKIFLGLAKLLKKKTLN